MQFCEVRNKITEHVFDTYEQPVNYDQLDKIYKLIHKISYQKLNINVDGCRHLMTSTSDREDIKNLVKNKSHYVSYNLFGTVTGRLTTQRDSNPISGLQWSRGQNFLISLRTRTTTGRHS
jgi:hypothetical protein